MDYWFEQIDKQLKKKDCDIFSITDSINQKLIHLYMNKNIHDAQLLLESDLKKYIDLSFKASSALEFISLLYDPNLEHVHYFLNWAKENNQLNHIHSQAIQNSILNAVNYNKLNLIDLLNHYEGLPPIDLSYCEYAAVTNCIPVIFNPKKEAIFQYFITQCSLESNPIIERCMKKNKREDMSIWFNTLKLKHQLDNGLNDNLNVKQKIKI